ncbi:hypothetical protein F4819DRAFT_451217 [Hypoxylon fuscum]|nr:hypothetical protein F4819DRAFT_451217 [Hypoxylon fuscum]
MDLVDDLEYSPGSGQSDAEPPISRKTVLRKRRRRPQGLPFTVPPLKRQKGIFYTQYLELFNEDIRNAADETTQDPENVLLKHAQIGSVTWSAAEKQTFFSALSRLGRDNIDAIASKIGTKSALEVRQYIVLLDEAERARRKDDGKRRRALRLVEIPAAVELSTELCLSLEAAADSLALRQEAYESSLEQKRWASRWLITPSLVIVLEHHIHQPQFRQELLTNLPFVELFSLRNWLKLSDRVFMNSFVVPDGNWRYVSEDPPSMRATALADFYALTLSITRRLVSASLFIAHTRIRAKQAGDRRHRTRAVVRTKDVQAAIASVGMKENSKEFWARAARRLRLDVYNDYEERGKSKPVTAEDDDDDDLSEEIEEDFDDPNDLEYVDDVSEDEGMNEDLIEEPDEVDDANEPNAMSYNEVEAALGFPTSTSKPTEPSCDLPDESSSSSSSEDESQHATDNEDDEGENPENQPLIKTEDQDEDILMADSDYDYDATIDLAAVRQDLHEALTYSAIDFVDTARARQTLEHRIREELRLEAEADRFDVQASAREEAELRNMLSGNDEVEEFGKGRREATPKAGHKRSGLVDLGGNWRDYTEYYSEWEFEDHTT